MRRIGGVVLDPHLADAKPLGEPVRPDQRGHAGRQRGLRAALEGQEVGVAPDVQRAGLDLPAQLSRVVEAGEVVLDLERAEADVAHEARLEGVQLSTFLAFEGFHSHASSLFALVSAACFCDGGLWSGFATSPRPRLLVA